MADETEGPFPNAGQTKLPIPLDFRKAICYTPLGTLARRAFQEYK